MQFLPDEPVVGHAHAPGRLDQPLGIVETQWRVGEVAAQRLQPFHQALEEGLEAEAARLEQVPTLGDARGGQEAQHHLAPGGQPLTAGGHLFVGDRDVGYLHHLVAGLHHRLPLASERVFGPHFLHSEGAPPPAVLPGLAPDASLLQPVHRQHDVGEESQRLGVEGEAELKPLAWLVAKDGPPVGEFEQVSPLARQRRLHSVGARHVAAPAALRPERADERGDGAGGDERAVGTLACLAVGAKLVPQRVEERTTDGRALVFVQFDCAPHFGDEAQAVGGEMELCH